MEKAKVKNSSIKFFVLLLLCLSFLFQVIFVDFLEAKEIYATNDSVYLGNGNWQWTIFLNGDEELLEDIKCVKYTSLHPRAPKAKKPKCTRGNPKKSFKWTDNWYGAFKIRAEVTFQSHDLMEFKHTLIFSSPKISQEKKLPITGGNTTKILRPRLYDWRIFLLVEDGIPEKDHEKILDQIQCVEYTLLPSFLNPVMEICDKGDKAKPFLLKAASWGTFTVDIRVYLKNGKSQYFKHRLKP